VLAELGSLHEERLDDPEAAANAYERASRSTRACPWWRRRSSDCIAKPSAGTRCAACSNTPPSRPEAQRAGFACALGDLLAERFALPAEAARAYEAALAREPRAQAAHRGLRRLAADRGDVDALLRITASEAAVTQDRGRLAELASELVRGFEQAGRREPALAWAQRWCESVPESTAALDACARLHAALGHDPELVECLERQALLLQGAARAANRRQLAQHHASHGREADSIRCLESALESDTGDLAALTALAELFERAGRNEDLVRVRRSLAAHAPPAQRRAPRCSGSPARRTDRRRRRRDRRAGAARRLRRSARRCAGAPRAAARAQRTPCRARHTPARVCSAALPPAAARRCGRAWRVALLLAPLERCAEAAAAYASCSHSTPACTRPATVSKRAARRG
jgi:tetratricopeptide (TPR) repeat protein